MARKPLVIEDVLVLIGAISWRVNFIEIQMQQAIMYLADEYPNSDNQVHRKRIECLISGDLYDILLKKLENIVRRSMRKPTVNEFLPIRKALADIGEDRNRYVHSLYIVRNGRIIRRKANRKIGSDKEMKSFDKRFSLNVLLELLDRSESTSAKFEKFIERRVKFDARERYKARLRRERKLRERV